MSLALRDAIQSARKWRSESMSLVLRGGEYIATEALTARVLSGLMNLARRRPLLVNGLELHYQDLAELAEEAERTGQPVWPRNVQETF
jgi:hypothetical protein